MTDLTQTVADTATNLGVDPNLALEVALAESGLDPNAVSPAGAMGVMQLMPGTAAQMNVSDPFDPEQNITGGVTYLGQLLAMFGGDQQAALAAYNWGPGNVQKAQATYGANWLAHAPAATQAYVAGIMGNLGTQYTATQIFGPAASAGASPGASSAAADFESMFSLPAGIDWQSIGILIGVSLGLFWFVKWAQGR
jgi:hypothetical protein